MEFQQELFDVAVQAEAQLMEQRGQASRLRESQRRPTKPRHVSAAALRIAAKRCVAVFACALVRPPRTLSDLSARHAAPPPRPAGALTSSKASSYQIRGHWWTPHCLGLSLAASQPRKPALTTPTCQPFVWSPIGRTHGLLAQRPRGSQPTVEPHHFPSMTCAATGLS